MENDADEDHPGEPDQADVADGSDEAAAGCARRNVQIERRALKSNCLSTTLKCAHRLLLLLFSRLRPGYFYLVNFTYRINTYAIARGM
jgi:hypothetical protein